MSELCWDNRRGDLLGDVRLDPQRAVATIRMRFPKRGLGGVLIVLTLLNSFMLLAAVMMSRDKRPRDPHEQTFFLAWGLLGTVGFSLWSTYHFTRRRQVTLRDGVASLESGWLLGRRRREFPLSDFSGLERSTREISGVTALTMVGSLAGVAVGHALGTDGPVFGRTRTYHCLEMVHRGTPSLNILLTAGPYATPIRELSQALADMFDLAQLTPTLQDTRPGMPREDRPPSGDPGPVMPDQPTASAAAPAIRPNASPPRPAAPPPGIDVQQDGADLMVLLPPSGKSRLAALALGIPFIGIGILCLALISGPGWWKGLIPLLIGAAILPIGFINTARRSTLRLTPEGLHYRMAALGTRESFVPWAGIRDMSIGFLEGRPGGLVLATDQREVWVAVGLRHVDLLWVADVIRDWPARRRVMS